MPITVSAALIARASVRKATRLEGRSLGTQHANSAGLRKCQIDAVGLRRCWDSAAAWKDLCASQVGQRIHGDAEFGITANIEEDTLRFVETRQPLLPGGIVKALQIDVEDSRFQLGRRFGTRFGERPRQACAAGEPDSLPGPGIPERFDFDIDDVYLAIVQLVLAHSARNLV